MNFLYLILSWLFTALNRMCSPVAANLCFSFFNLCYLPARCSEDHPGKNSSCSIKNNFYYIYCVHIYLCVCVCVVCMWRVCVCGAYVCVYVRVLARVCKCHAFSFHYVSLQIELRPSPGLVASAFTSSCSY